MRSRKTEKIRNSIFHITLLIIIILPLFIITPNGNTALSFDFATLQFHFFNYIIEFNNFFVASIFILFCTFSFIFFTQIFGRIWCGWLCPHSVFLDFINKVNQYIASDHKMIINIIISFFSAIMLTLIWFFFFTTPYNFLDILFGESASILIPIFIVTSTFLFIDFAFIQYKWCKFVCPYAKIQSVMSDEDTLFIGMKEDKLSECIKCQACVRICPVLIDPRKTPILECIYCERCIDACDKALSKKGKRSILGYNWGKTFKFNFLRPNPIITFIIAFAFFIYFIYLIFFNDQFDVKVSDIISTDNRSNYEVLINYKNYDDYPVIIKIYVDDNMEISPDNVVLRPKQKIQIEHALDFSDISSIPGTDIKLTFTSNTNKSKDIIIPPDSIEIEKE